MWYYIIKLQSIIVIANGSCVNCLAPTSTHPSLLEFATNDNNTFILFTTNNKSPHLIPLLLHVIESSLSFFLLSIYSWYLWKLGHLIMKELISQRTFLGIQPISILREPWSNNRVASILPIGHEFMRWNQSLRVGYLYYTS